MIDCAALEDRMPDVVHGEAAWSPEEASHLAGCPDCSAAWQLVGSTRRLGTWTPSHPSRMEEILLARLRADLPVRRTGFRRAGRWQGALWGALAATLVLVVGQKVTGGPAQAGPPAAEAMLFPELMSLSEDQLRQVLQEWAGEEEEYAGSMAPSLEDLDEAQLRRVLQQVEEGGI